MNVPRETDQLTAFASGLIKWNAAIRLIGRSNNRPAVDAEIRDSLALEDHLVSDDVLDLGSGNGLPALPLAIRAPRRRFTLIESDARKAAFLNAMRRDLGLGNVTVLRARIEDVPPLNVPEIIARAVAPLPRLLALALPHLAAAGRMVLLKGDAVMEEVRQAATSFDFEHEIVDLAPARGCVLVLRNIRPIQCVR